MLATLGALKDELSIAQDNHRFDNRLKGTLAGASDLIEKYCNRIFGYAINYVQYLPGSDSMRLYLRRIPVLSVASVAHRHSDYVFPSDAYLIFGTEEDGGYLYRDRGWPGTYNVNVDLTMDFDYTNPRYHYVVTYTAGYILPPYAGIVDANNNPAGGPATLPDGIAYACVRQAAYLYSRPTALRTEKMPGGYEYETWQQNDVLDEIKPFINPYCRNR